MDAVFYAAMMVGAFIAALLVIGLAMEAIVGPSIDDYEEAERIMGWDDEDSI